MKLDRHISRRGFILRGAIGGAAVSVGLPLLDGFLNDSGTAFAATLGGGKLPVRFGTWFWGCGMIPDRWEPKTKGANYDLPPELEPIRAVQQHVSVLTGFNVDLAGKTAAHQVSNSALRTGAAAEEWNAITGPTFDVAISDTIGGGSFFRFLNMSSDGDPRTSYSYRDAKTLNAAIPNPAELYAKIFGPDFHDPNKADFTPDPNYVARRSILSAVSEERKSVMAQVGAADRARLDQYFTSVREMEQKLSLQLQKPPPAEACLLPKRPETAGAGDPTDVDQCKANHKIMSELLAMALACNQTRVFNMAFTTETSTLRRAGVSTGYHQITHEELVDRKIGYQPTVDGYVIKSMEAWADFVSTLAAIKEGDGTLLDNMLVFAHSDVSFAKNHVPDGIPMMLAGTGGGKVKTGIHINGGGQPTSQVVLTMQQLMGVSVDSWGSGNMQTRRSLSEILV